MAEKHKKENRELEDIDHLLLKAHRKGVERAIELSIRTGVPLVVEVDGKIKEIKPKYKYVKVPISFDEKTLKLSKRKNV